MRQSPSSGAFERIQDDTMLYFSRELPLTLGEEESSESFVENNSWTDARL